MAVTSGNHPHRYPSKRAVILVTAVMVIAQLAGCRDDSQAVNHRAASGSSAAGAAANRMVFWTGCDDVAGLSNAKLDAWHNRGVGGFVCVIQHLHGLGGDQEFSADSKATLAGPSYSLQRRIRTSKIVARAKARGIKLWLGFYLSNSHNEATPLENWFDDSAWSKELLPVVADLAGAARKLGFAGLAFDEEMYDNATWDWNFAGNRRRESEVRAKARARGAQMMRAIVRAFPEVDLIDYGTYFPDGWNALVQQEINDVRRPYRASVQINFWDGLTSVRGYGAIRFMDATFYKTAHLNGATWDTALGYNVNRLMAYFSRNLTNWSYAASRINVSPFAWIDGDVENEGAFTAPRPPSYVAEQLAAFSRWGMGGTFAVYAYSGLDGGFDYAPYVNGMKAAARGVVVDSQAPTITVERARRDGATVTLSGTATDNMAISSVQSRAGTRSGRTKMTWKVTGGDYYTGYHWQMNWTATVPAPSGQVVTVVAQDTKGNKTALRETAP